MVGSKFHMTLSDKTFGKSQVELFAAHQPDSPAASFDADYARRALDELFINTQQYSTGKALDELYAFMRRFHFYSPFNAMLLHIQNPGTKYAAPASRWKKDYERVVKPGARPLVILQPMGPVMFVFDVSDVEPASPDAPPLPKEVTDPFEPYGDISPKHNNRLIKNTVRDGVHVAVSPRGSESAGQISPSKVQVAMLQYSETVSVQRYYDIVLNGNHTRAARFATLSHELGHLYCGHLGLPFKGCKWWPDRRGLERIVEEVEAESVAYLVCTRLGVQPPSAEYLAGYLGKEQTLPRISLERVLVAAGLIESMCKQPMPPSRSPKRI